ncbi:MAG: hypothetical protein KA322_01750 [Chitinophagales bacterium]|jgi:hypothetical protein|nr:hypothetical protein [Chitinophagales bacterium]
MTAKLTLSIDSKIIEKAKKYAKKEGKSLSSMVEDYLAFATQKETSKPAKSDYVILVEKLAGSLKMELPKGVSDKELLQQALEEKYLKRRK